MCIVCVSMGLYLLCHDVSVKSENNFVESMIPSYLMWVLELKPNWPFFYT